MSPYHILPVFLIIILSTSISCLKNDPIRIMVIQCDNCNASSYTYASIRPNETQNVWPLMVPRSSDFFIVQVHSPLQAVRLSYEQQAQAQNSVYGTNVGLNQLNGDKAVHTFYLYGNFTIERQILLAITSYTNEAPMPGGCNMEFNTPTAPYQKVSHTDAMITVDVQSASIDAISCEKQANITLDFYQLFVEANAQDLNASFATIIRMLNVDSIKLKGHKVIKPWNGPVLRRYFSNYRGFGVVFAVIATHGNASAAYVPAITFGCDMRKGVESCFDNGRNIMWYEMAVFWFLFLLLPFPPLTNFITFFNIAFYGIYAILTYVGYGAIPYLWVHISYSAVIIGGISALTLRISNFELYQVITKIYAAHLLVAFVFTVTAIGSFQLCQTAAYFWILYISVVCAMMLPFLFNFILSAVICISIHLSVMIDILFCGGALLYMNINAVRIASVANFHLASLYLPPNSVSVILVSVFCVFCFCIRICYNRNRDDDDDEHRPLLD